VDCPEIRDSFLRGNVPTGAAVEEHLKWCPHCAQLFENAATLGRKLGLVRPAAAPNVNAVLQAVEQDIANEKGLRPKLRSLRTRSRRALALGAAALLIAVGGIARLRADFEHYPLGAMALITGLYVAAVAVGAWFTLRPLAAAGPREPLQLATALSIVLLPLLLAFFAVQSGHPLTEIPSEQYAASAFKCFAYGSELGLPLLILLWALDRADRISWATALLAGATLGVTGSLILQLHCPVTHLGHLLLGHALIGLVWGVAFGTVAFVRERVA
jgi:hypothetical protein